MNRLVRFVRPYLGLAVFSILTLLLMIVLELSIPRLIQRLVDYGIRRGDMRELIICCAAMLGLSFLSMVAAVLNSNASIKVGEGVARDLRRSIFSKIMGLPSGSLDRYSTGQLMVRLSADALAIQRLFQISLRIGTRAPLTIVGSVALMCATSLPLALAVMPIMGLTLLATLLFSLRMEPLFGRAQASMDRLNTVLQENIAGVRLVRGFARSRHEESRFESANAEYAASNLGVMAYASAMSPSLSFLVSLALVAVVWLGGRAVMADRLTNGQLIAFTAYLLATMNPLMLMSQLANTWASGLASAARVLEVLDAKGDLMEAAQPRSLPPGQAGPLCMEGISFGYPGSSLLAVEGVDLCLRRGKTLAILGATGSGKSTLASLIPRFYDPSRGRLSLSGIDLRELSFDGLLGRVAMVGQESVLFRASLGENLRYGRPDASQADVEEAAKAAQIHDFIIAQAQGYDSPVEERGANLSGGQRQRIAIARAIVCRPDILILDDSTSAVDVETETRIQDALPRVLPGASFFIVAQRISTVLRADWIAVMDGGRVVAQGRHQDLMRGCQLYREIYDSQLGGGQDGRG